MVITRYLNWYEAGFVSPVVDQGVTSACWIIAPLKQAESAYNILYDLKDEKMELFSIQEPVDLIYKMFPPSDARRRMLRSPSGSMCGHPILTYRYLYEYGVHRRRDYLDYPSFGVEGEPRVIANVEKLSITEWLEMKNWNMPSIVRSLNYCPLVGTLNVAASYICTNIVRDPFYNYSYRNEGHRLQICAPIGEPSTTGLNRRNIFEDEGFDGEGARLQICAPVPSLTTALVPAPTTVPAPAPTTALALTRRPPGHLVLVIGYAMDDMLGPYFLIQNSWGESWGFSGYCAVRWGDLGQTFYSALGPYLVNPYRGGLILPRQLAH